MNSIMACAATEPPLTPHANGLRSKLISENRQSTKFKIATIETIENHLRLRRVNNGAKRKYVISYGSVHAGPITFPALW